MLPNIFMLAGIDIGGYLPLPPAYRLSFSSAPPNLQLKG
jgi:hypothetical protein